MISRQRICSAIDDAADSFDGCWDTLAHLKEGRRASARWRDDFAAFQYRLGRALFRLDELYREIAAKERSLINRKSSLSPPWFRRRMKQLADYHTALKRAMRIGKQIGDSFAWIFYQRETTMVRKHLEHAGNLHMPPGIGGRGELGFIKHVPIIDGHMVIYHGITNFLRIGDISFIDPTGKLIAIGELKTRQEGQTYITNIFLLADEDLNKRLPSVIDAPGREERRSRLDEMPPVKATQLKRQMKRMSDLLDVRTSKKRFHLNAETNLHKIEGLLRNLRSDKITYRRIDDGLTALGVKSSDRVTRLSTRLLPRCIQHSSDLSVGIENYAQELLTSDQSINSLQYLRVRMHYRPGLTPLFWSPIPAALLKPLVFEEALVSLLFNPAALVQKLRAHGYEVKLDSKHVPERIVHHRDNELSTVFEGVWYLLDLIRHQFYSEAAIVRMVHRLFELVEREGVSPHVRVEIDFQQIFDEASSEDIPRSRSRRSRRPSTR